MQNEAQRVVFLEGKRVILRPFSRSDVPTITRWVNDPEVREFISVVFPKNEREEEDWVNKGSDDKNIVLAIETKDGRLIGSMGLHRINWVNSNATTGALIGEKDCWGQGFGTDAKMALLDYAFNTLGLHKICSSVIAFNRRSLNYSLHCGYKVEGRRKEQFFRNGKYWDQIDLGLFKKDWLPIWRKYKKTGKIK